MQVAIVKQNYAAAIDVDVRAGKDALGMAEWQIKVENESCQDLFATLAIGENPGKASCKDDFDTYARNRPIRAESSRVFTVPANGNGVKEGAPFRLTIRDGDRAVLGVLDGIVEGHHCGC